MADNGIPNDLLYDTLRKKINSMLENGGRRPLLRTPFSSKDNNTPEVVTQPRFGKVGQHPCSAANNLVPTEPKYTPVLNDPSIPLLEADIKKMRDDLRESHDLLKSLGDKFSSMDFTSLKSRLKDMSTNEKYHEGKLGKDVKKMLDESYNNNKLDSLTREMGEKFSMHPGEFGDIPELKDFYQSCNQANQVIDKVKQKEHAYKDLTDRVYTSAMRSYERVDQIHKILESYAYKK